MPIGMENYLLMSRIGGLNMNRKARILIIEDDKTIREELEMYLSVSGYEVRVLSDFSNTVKDALNQNPDLILLDVNLPGTNGMAVCEQIRRTSQVPIIFVTGNNTSMDELNGILRGGDDYITKPYQLPVLMARIGAVLRRTLGDGDRVSVKSEYKGVLLDIAAAQISKGQEKRELTKNELRILHCLYQHPGEIVSRADMIDYLWDNEVFIDDNTLSVHVARLRNKLSEIGAADFIETKRGLGYRI